MEKKKNIICISGSDSTGRRLEVERLVSAFQERQDGINMDFYDFESVNDWKTIGENMHSMGLFAEKRLFIFRGNREKEKKRGKKSDDTHPLISLLENLPDETFVVVDGPRNEDELGKYLLLRSDVRMFDDVWSEEVWHHRYPSLDTTLIREIIKRYRMSVTEDSAEKRDTSHEIHLALEKLSLLSLSKQIETQDIDETMGMSAGAKTFDLVDAVMRGDASRALRLFRIIIREETSDRFLPSFIGLMRNSVYTRFLREKEIHESEIVRTLGAHPFVVQKALGSRIDWSTLRDFYDKLIDVNIASRSGRGGIDPELGRIFGIERALIGLKK